ncbi:MAG: hypothetical protein AAF404_22270 [Pseudomonadota bacterium]
MADYVWKSGFLANNLPVFGQNSGKRRFLTRRIPAIKPDFRSFFEHSPKHQRPDEQEKSFPQTKDSRQNFTCESGCKRNCREQTRCKQTRQKACSVETSGDEDRHAR